MLCETCLHRVVCGKNNATGGVNKCEHYAEERHGRNDYTKDDDYDEWYSPDARCSLCGCVWKPDDYDNEVNYCPNCGAKMDGGQNDG